MLILTKKGSVIAKASGEEEVTLTDNMREFLGGVQLFCILIVVKWLQKSIHMLKCIKIHPQGAEW